MKGPRYIVLTILLHNKYVGNNDVEMVHSIKCSSDEIARDTYQLLKDVQPHTTGFRNGIPDELIVRMNRSPISNLWKLARQLDDDKALLDVRLEETSPQPEPEEDVTDLVYNHTWVDRGY